MSLVNINNVSVSFEGFFNEWIPIVKHECNARRRSSTTHLRLGRRSSLKSLLKSLPRSRMTWNSRLCMLAQQRRRVMTRFWSLSWLALCLSVCPSSSSRCVSLCCVFAQGSFPVGECIGNIRKYANLHNAWRPPPRILLSFRTRTF